MRSRPFSLEATLHGRLRAASNDAIDAGTHPIALSEPCFYKTIEGLLRSMRSGKFAKYFAVRADSGASDCLQAIVLRVGLIRVAEGTEHR